MKEFNRHRSKEVYDRVLNTLPEGRLLDVGCGNGEFVFYANQSGRQAVGIDTLPKFIEYAEFKLGVEAYGCDIENYWGTGFDVITFNSSLQYMDSPYLALKIAHSKLKPNGTLYIETTNNNAFALRIRRLFTKKLSPYQKSTFTPRSLLCLLNRIGFKATSLEVKGMRGGGRTRFNWIWKILIFIGGIMGQGHLIYCWAKK